MVVGAESSNRATKKMPGIEDSKRDFKSFCMKDSSAVGVTGPTYNFLYSQIHKHNTASGSEALPLQFKVFASKLTLALHIGQMAILHHARS